MNPYDEKWLRDEVIYLHGLWHQGPPQNANPNPRKRPRPLTQKSTKNRKKFVPSGSYPPPRPDHGCDWSIFVNPPPPSSSGWPEPKSKPDQPTKPASVEDQARFASLQMQSKVLDGCRVFFRKRVVDEESDDDDDDEESEVNKFFMGIFVNNSELRDYYEENHEEGEFFCLVCGGIGENVGKRFKGCAGLVQHCMSILKTKRKTGHRAFGLVVCKVLGWDIDRWPVILLKGEPLSRRLANSVESQLQNSLKGDESNKKVGNLETEISDVEVKKGASNSLVNGDDLEVILGNVESVNADGSESVEKEVSGAGQSNGEVMICENSKGDDANKNVESLEISYVEPNKVAVNDLGLESSQIKSTEWPCIEPADESTSTTLEWPSFKPCNAPVNHVVPDEEQIRSNMLKLQQSFFGACKQFLSTTAESDSDEDENYLMDEDGSKEFKEFNFFLRLFTENNELRSYYGTNCRGGDFCCLVCCGIGKKAWRTFKDCVGLVQHSTAISRTKRKRAHRAFGLVICKVLGWDVDRLPSIVLKSEAQNLTLEDLSQCQRDGKAACDKDKPDAPMDETYSGSTSKEVVDAQQNNSALMSGENSLNEEPIKDDNLENRTLNIGASEDKAVHSLNSSMENGTQPKPDNIQVENSSVDEPEDDAHNLR